jgi:MOSC domain-containing protein YiiM
MLLIKDLQNTFSGNGTVMFISIRPGREIPVNPVNEVLAVEGVGLSGDRYKTHNGKRQVTLIQHEHVEAMTSFLQRNVSPTLLRRNIVVRGINLLSLKGHRFQIGEAILEYSGECHPCSRMEEALGPGGYNAMRGHGGITAKIISGGLIRVGDTLSAVADP